MKQLLTGALAAGFVLIGASAYAADAAAPMDKEHSAEKAEWKACMDKMAAANPGMSHNKMKKACHTEMHHNMHHDNKGAGAPK